MDYSTQAPLSFRISPRVCSNSESTSPSNHLVFCHPLLHLPSVFLRIGSFSISWEHYNCTRENIKRIQIFLEITKSHPHFFAVSQELFQQTTKQMGKKSIQTVFLPLKSIFQNGGKKRMKVSRVDGTGTPRHCLNKQRMKGWQLAFIRSPGIVKEWESITKSKPSH